MLGIIKGINRSQSWQERQKQYRGKDPLICKICKRSMHFVETHTPIKLTHVKASFQRTFGCKVFTMFTLNILCLCQGQLNSFDRKKNSQCGKTLQT